MDCSGNTYTQYSSFVIVCIKCSCLSLHCDIQRCVCLGMGAVTGDMFPSQYSAASVSTGTGLETFGELQRVLATIITAGIL